MSTQPAEPSHPGSHLELAVDEQLARAGCWEATDQPVLDDLSDGGGAMSVILINPFEVPEDPKTT